MQLYHEMTDIGITFSVQTGRPRFIFEFVLRHDQFHPQEQLGLLIVEDSRIRIG